MREIDLFQFGSFKLRGGGHSRFKIECDALSDEEIKGMAELLIDCLPPYCEVIGIPTGGDRIAAAMESRATGNEEHPVLIVDDVYTTGGSMLAACQVFNVAKPHRNWRGAVLFAREKVREPWITALFTMASADPT